jgi:hypothetical protein
VESQFQGQGTLLGVPFVDYSTYSSVYRPDGNFTGSADGVIFSQEAEAASYTGSGVGHMLGVGGRAGPTSARRRTSRSSTRPPCSSSSRSTDRRDMEIKYYEWK